MDVDSRKKKIPLFEMASQLENCAVEEYLFVVVVNSFLAKEDRKIGF